MKHSSFSTIVLFALLTGVVISCYFNVTSADRTRFEVEKLRAELRALKEELAGKTASPVSAQREEKPSKEIPFANARYFDKNAVSGGRFIAVQSADTKNMNMLLNNDAAVSQLWSKTYDNLAERNLEDISGFEPLAAESWKRSSDGLRYRIRLRKGMLWHDFRDPVTGKDWKNVPVTAHDYKFYIDVVKDPKVDALPLRVYLQDLSEIRVLNDLEFEVIWKKPYFLSESVTLSLIPLPRHFYHAYKGPFDGEKFNSDHERNRMIVGFGPYYFVRWDKSSRIILKRFEKYYGKRGGIMPPLENYVIEIIQHPSTRFQALESGAIDSMSLSPDQWLRKCNTPSFGKNGFLVKYKRPSMVYNYLGFNLKKKIFRDAETRRALSHLVDRKRIVREIYYDLAVPVSGPFFPESEANDPSIKPYAFSVEEARSMLDSAGWKDADGDGILERDGEKLKFTVLYPTANPIYQRMLPMIKEDMARAGVQMELLGLEWSVCIQKIEKKNYDVCALAWMNSLLPDPYQLWHSSQAAKDGSSNHVSYASPEADRLIEAIRVEFDPAKRKKLYHAFHALIHRDQPYIFLFSPYDLSAMASRYRNSRVFPLGISENLLWVPKNEQLAVPGM